MKFSTPFFLLAVWMSGTLADFSLTLSNKQYLSPPIQELPINEDYYKTQRQKNFAENNYGNSQYQVFQVRNHYEVSNGSGDRGNRQKTLDKEMAFAKNNYTPLRQKSPEMIRIEHINAPAEFLIDDPNLDASYLGFALDNNDNQQHENKNNIPVPFPSNFRHTVPEKSNRPQSFSVMQQYHSTNAAVSTFKGTDYLPPKMQDQQYFIPQVQNSLEAQGYQGNQQQNRLTGVEQIAYNKNNVFKGPDYLPPQQDTSVSGQHNHKYNGPDYLPPNQHDAFKVQRSIASNGGYKGPDYLPPQQHVSLQPDNNFRQSAALKGLDYERFKQHQSGQLAQNLRTQSEFKGFDNSSPQTILKGPDYLPPQPGNIQYQQNTFRPSQQFEGYDYLPTENSLFRGPDYLPPQYEQKQVNNPYKSYSPPENIPAANQGQKTSDQNTLFRGPDYMPPQYEGKQANNLYKSPDYSPPENTPAANQGQKISDQNTLFRGPDYLPPQKEGKQPNYPFKAPDYLPPGNTPAVNLGQKTDQNASPLQHEGKQPNNLFKGPDYLPPGNSPASNQGQKTSDQNTLFRGPDYLPPQNEGKQPNYPFKAPDYLPPGNTPGVNRGQKSDQNSSAFQHEGKLANTPFKGPDYLPPHPSQSVTPLKGPDYLPPVRNPAGPQQEQIQNLPAGYDFKKPPNAEQAIEELHKLPEESKVSESLNNGRNGPTNSNYVPKEQVESDSKSGILDFKKPENSEEAIRLLHSQDTSFTSKEKSLPVYNFQRTSNSQNIENQLQNANAAQQSVGPQSNSLTGSLTTGSDLQKSIRAESAFNQLHNQQATLNSESYHTEAHQFATLQRMQIQTNQVVDQARSQPSMQQFKGPDYLPPSKGSQSFKGPEYLPPSLSSQTFKGPDYLPPSSEYQTAGALNNGSGTKSFENSQHIPPNSGSQNYKGPDYLPPISSQRATTQTQLNQKPSEVVKGPDYLPPENKQPSYQSNSDNQFKGPDYLPPLVSKTIKMYPLSSYMTNIKPNERYGSRRPFPEYGLPPAKTITFPTTNDIAPMYRQPALRPQYYAMSYANNALNAQTSSTLTPQQHPTTTTLNQQARQILQTFMPEDIRQTTPASQISAPIEASKTTASLHTSKPAKAKIRTVQIVNTNAVKTLKVLETLDDTGVKTLKILGSSNESPMGDHRVIKVVSGSQNQSVQTVKIFNDHQDVTTDENAGSTDGANNSYLPPRTKRNPTNAHKTKLHHRI